MQESAREEITKQVQSAVSSYAQVTHDNKEDMKEIRALHVKMLLEVQEMKMIFTSHTDDEMNIIEDLKERIDVLIGDVRDLKNFRLQIVTITSAIGIIIGFFGTKILNFLK